MGNEMPNHQASKKKESVQGGTELEAESNQQSLSNSDFNVAANSKGTSQKKISGK